MIVSTLSVALCVDQKMNGAGRFRGTNSGATQTLALSLEAEDSRQLPDAPHGLVLVTSKPVLLTAISEAGPVAMNVQRKLVIDSSMTGIVVTAINELADVKLYYTVEQ